MEGIWFSTNAPTHQHPTTIRYTVHLSNCPIGQIVHRSLDLIAKSQTNIPCDDNLALDKGGLKIHLMAVVRALNQISQTN